MKQLDLLDLIALAVKPPPEARELVVLRRVEPSRNMRRFYALRVEPTLFGEFALIREWGRIGSSGQLRTTLFACRADARHAFDRQCQVKKRRGYRVTDSEAR